MEILIKNGHVIDPAKNIDRNMDVLIENNIIKKVGPDLQAPEASKVIDATNMCVVPGLIDMHVHLRDPGWPHKETVASGTLAAAAGGFTTICAMPNTNPVTDNIEVMNEILMKARKEGLVNVSVVGSITKGLEGNVLSSIQTKVCAISDDGKTVANAELLKAAMIQAKRNDITVLSHCEDLSLVNGGHMNAGKRASELGIKGISNDSEEVIIARDIILARTTGARLHICHVSTSEGLNHIRIAKEQGLPISAEVCPHHFTLADDDIPGPDANYKMSPPLRSHKDIIALKEALKNNTIEVIATDHAPHHENDKNCSFEEAANGIIGLETAVPLCITELSEILTPTELIAKLTINPAKILRIDRGTLTPGAVADITLIDANDTYTIDKNTFRSKSRNTPFHGHKIRGRVIYTIVDGRVVYDYRQAN